MSRRLLWLVVLAATLSLLSLASSEALAQEAAGFMTTFDDGSLEGWEHGQDVIVEDGVLRLASENPVFRMGNWSIGSLVVRARSTGASGFWIVHYQATDQGSYNLRIATDEWALERSDGPATTLLAAAPPEGLDLSDWLDIEVTLVGGEHRVTAAGREVLRASEQDPLPSGTVGFVPSGGLTLEIDAVTLVAAPSGEESPGAPAAAAAPEGEPGAPLGEPEIPVAPPEQPTLTTVSGTQTAAGQTGGFFSGQANPTELSTFAINLALAAVCSFVLGLVYTYWGSSLSNRRKFAANFIFITVTTTFIILVVRSSIALSLGLVGALSITRFRHAIKEPEELAYLFVAIGIGIGLGDNQRLITLLALAVIIFIAAVMRLVRRSHSDVNLHLNLGLPADSGAGIDEIMELLRRHFSKVKLLRFDESSEVTELSFVVEFRRMSDLGSVRAELKQLSPAVEISFLDNRGIW